MNFALLLLAQLALLVCWYIVPAAATLPAWVIFLPAIAAGLLLVWVASLFIIALIVDR